MQAKASVNHTNVVTAAFFLVVAAAGYLGSARLSVGSAVQMGAGYIPRLLSFLLAGFGIVLMVQAFRGAPERLEAWSLRPLLCIIGVPVLFGSFIDALGLPPTAIACTALAGLASAETRWIEVALLGLGLAVFTYLLFVSALGLPMRLGPEW